MVRIEPLVSFDLLVLIARFVVDVGLAMVKREVVEREVVGREVLILIETVLRPFGNG